MISKTHWLKHPKTVPPKLNLDRNINNSKFHIQGSFFENVISGIQLFKICPYVPVDIIRVSLNFRFSSESLKAHKNQRKNSLLILQYSFTQKTSLILRTSTHLTLKTICSRNTAKNLSGFTNIPTNTFLFGVRKNIFTARFPDAQEPHYLSILKVSVCIFLYISVKRFSFQRRSKILPAGGGLGGS